MTSENDTSLESVARDRNDIPEQELAKALSEEDDSHTDPEMQEPLSEGTARSAPRWRVAKSLLALRKEVNAMAPNRDKSSDGTIGDQRHCGGAGRSDHCPNVLDGQIGVVTAMDITHDKAGGCDAQDIADTIRARRDPRVKYIIWNRQIANSSPIGNAEAWQWRPYTGSNPHNKHIHISVKPIKDGPSGYDTESSWGIHSEDDNVS
jgi:hypothetical protein